MRDPNGISRGSGFVTFSTPEEANRAVSIWLIVFIFEIKYLIENFISDSDIGNEWKNGFEQAPLRSIGTAQRR